MRLRELLKGTTDTIEDVVRAFGDEYPARIDMLIDVRERIDAALASATPQVKT